MVQYRNSVMLATLLFAATFGLGAGMADAEQLAQRFRPYYKFTLEDGGKPEPCRPCSWQWFATHSSVFRGKTQIVASAQLRSNPGLLLAQPDADIRTAKDRTGPLSLRPDRESQAGETWENV